MMSRLLVTVALSIALLLPAAHKPSFGQSYDPISAYEPRTIEGFYVLVSKRLLEHEDEATAVLDELRAQLERVADVVPPRPLARLRKVKIWVERDNRKDKAAEFHPSGDWLREHGYNPAKAGCVEIANGRIFLDWSHRAQPWALFHELAHSYHFLVLGADHPAVLKAYQNAIDDGLYTKVGYVLGGEKKGYAATNPKEYFAELSESYFGKNDFYPYTRAELETHDPMGYRLMQQAWGKPRGTKPEKKGSATGKS